MGGLENVIHWVKKGNCVVLHEDGYRGKMHYTPNPANKKPKLIVIDINPQWNLLDDEEWPLYLKDAGCTFVPYDAEKLKDLEEMRMYRFAYQK